MANKTEQAVSEGRTVYVYARRDAQTTRPILKPASHNRKLSDERGGRWRKGPWIGMPLYSLTLEERATCDSACPMRAICYGNNTPFAHRFEANDALMIGLASELDVLARRYPNGFSVRLHVLGDFFSRAYVYWWWQQLARHPMLRVYGFTHRQHGIKSAIDETREAYPNRFVIRQSDATPSGQTGGVANVNDSRFPTCPVQSGKVRSCLDCGLCPNTNIIGISWQIH